MIKPTIGRVVWYWASKEEAEEPGAQARAAIVVHVHDDYCVNLSVFDRNGDSHPLQQVPLFQAHPGESRPDCAHCEWMPYQKGQAAKQESPIDASALLSRLAAVESELQTMRQFIGNVAKDVVQRQGGPVENTQDTAKPQPPSLLKPASQIPPPAVPGKPDGFA